MSFSAYAKKSKHLRVADITQPLRLLIEKVVPEELKNSDGVTETKLVMHFRGADQDLPLNETNRLWCEEHFSDSPSEAVGKQLELYIDKTVNNPNGGRGGIRLRIPQKPLEEEEMPF